MAHRVISMRCGTWSLSEHSGLLRAVRPADLWVHGPGDSTPPIRPSTAGSRFLNFMPTGINAETLCPRTSASGGCRHRPQRAPKGDSAAGRAGGGRRPSRAPLPRRSAWKPAAAAAGGTTQGTLTRRSLNFPLIQVVRPLPRGRRFRKRQTIRHNIARTRLASATASKTNRIFVLAR
jgi:hypothetical protein